MFWLKKNILNVMCYVVIIIIIIIIQIIINLEACFSSHNGMHIIHLDTNN